MISLIRKLISFSSIEKRKTRVLLCSDGLYYPQYKSLLLIWLYCLKDNPKYDASVDYSDPVCSPPRPASKIVVGFKTEREAIDYLEGEFLISGKKECHKNVVWESA